MANNDDEKARAIFEEAEKRAQIKPKTGFAALFSGKSNASKEQAVEMYVKAGQSFKITKNWDMAGLSYQKAAEISQTDLNNHIDSTQYYIESGNAFKKSDPTKAIESYLKAIEIYTENGRFSMVAKYYLMIAEMYELELMDISNSCAYYQKAADFFKSEESNTQANKCLLKLASHYAIQAKYQEAINIYESVCKTSLDSNLLKYSAKEYLFKALLCHLCVDQLSAVRSIDQYVAICETFTESREYNLIQKLIESMEGEDVDAFTDAVQKYDSISRLDSWTTTLLTRIKKSLEGESDIC